MPWAGLIPHPYREEQPFLVVILRRDITDRYQALPQLLASHSESGRDLPIAGHGAPP